MTTIDHKAEAERLMNSDGSEYGDQGFGKVTDALKGQIAATLYLAEQQRIANLIALSQVVDGNGWQAEEPLNALFAYRHPDPEDGFEGLHIRPAIAQALGLDKEDAS